MLIGRLRTAWKLRQQLLEMVVQYLPGDQGFSLRHRFYARRLRHLGQGALIDVGVQFINPGWISIGENTWIDKFVVLIGAPPSGEGRRIYRVHNPNYHGGEGELYIGRGCHLAPYTLVSGMGGVWIGDHVGLAAGVKVYSFSHTYHDPAQPDDFTIFKYTPMASMSDQSMILGPVVLSDDCGLAANVVVTPGVTIGEGAWVGGGSLVTKDIPPFKVAVGSPPRVIRDRRGLIQAEKTEA